MGRVTVQWQGPDWIRPAGDAWGHTIFHRITSVDRRGVALPDSAFELKYLDRISLNFGEVTSQRLAKLAAVPRLTSLSLSGPQVDDSVLRQAGRIPNLQSLTLLWTAVSEEALATFRREHPQLEISYEGTAEEYLKEFVPLEVKSDAAVATISSES